MTDGKSPWKGHEAQALAIATALNNVAKSCAQEAAKIETAISSPVHMTTILDAPDVMPLARVSIQLALVLDQIYQRNELRTIVEDLLNRPTVEDDERNTPKGDGE